MSVLKKVFNKLYSLIPTAILMRFSWFFYLKFPIGKKVYIIGTPEHENLGDSAIAIAERIFLSSFLKDNRIKEITAPEYRYNNTIIKKHINKKRLICGIGGGNIGNQWYSDELIRYQMLSDFPYNPIIIFPQTVYFTKDANGKKAFDNSKIHYEKHNNLTIAAREKESFKYLKTLYLNPKIIMAPDIVLSTYMSDYGVSIHQRSRVLLVFRNDAERAMREEERERIIDYLKNNKMNYCYTDMYAVENVNKENRMTLVKKKLEEFASADLVITDRLHGMIFSAITDTQCIVFGNYNQKVKGSYDWIKELSYITYVNGIQDAINALCRIKETNKKKRKYASYNKEKIMPYFDELKKLVKVLIK